MATKNEKAVTAKLGGSRGNSKNIYYGNPPKDKQFSTTHRPDREKQLKAIREFHTGRNLIKEMLQMKFNFDENSKKIEEELLQAFGPQISNANAGGLMVFVQLQKAIIEADSHAFTLLMNRAFGPPKIETESPSQIMEIRVITNDEELKEGLNTGIYPVS